MLGGSTQKVLQAAIYSWFFGDPKMCMKAVGKGPLADIPDWFVDLKLVEMWHDEEDYCNEFAEWSNSY